MSILYLLVFLVVKTRNTTVKAKTSLLIYWFLLNEKRFSYLTSFGPWLMRTPLDEVSPLSSVFVHLCLSFFSTDPDRGTSVVQGVRDRPQTVLRVFFTLHPIKLKGISYYPLMFHEILFHYYCLYVSVKKKLLSQLLTPKLSLTSIYYE